MLRLSIASVAFMTFSPIGHAAEPPSIYAPKNLTAWCVVPFDAKKRSPDERVAMLKRLGFTRFAYDWRAEHLKPEGIEREFDLLLKEKIALQAVWFPSELNKDAKYILDVLREKKLSTELWVMWPQPDAKLSDADKIKACSEPIAKLAKEVGKDGHTLCLYNHGGWTGEPANLAALAKAIGEKNVGIAYNLHHGHDHLAKLADHLAAMKPYLRSVNLNGMEAEGDKKGRKILCLGDGTDDAGILKTIADSGYTGPIGIIGHTDDDAEDRLADNLLGLKALLRNDGFRAGYRTSTVRSLTMKLEPIGPKKVLTFTVVGPKLKAEDFKVYAVEPNAAWTDLAKKKPMLGETTADGDRLSFVPRFPPVAGQSYIAVCGKSIAEFAIPEAAMQNVQLDCFPPSGSIIPENILRFTVKFPKPMKRGDVLKHISLNDSEGKAIVAPFHETSELLWSKDGKRLTLLIDPGRIKSGVKPNVDLGPVLKEGSSVELAISNDWEDENGATRPESFRAKFRVGPVQREGIEVVGFDAMRFNPENGRPTLRIDLGRLVEPAQVEGHFRVEDENGKRITGATSYERSSTFVEFNFAGIDTAKLVLFACIDPELEDVCGNRLGLPFEDRDLSKKPDPKPFKKKIEFAEKR